MKAMAQPMTIAVGDAHRVSGLLQVPPEAHACYVMAHGAGAGMAHPFMAAIANGLAERGIATLRYQFPYMEQGSKRPDPPKLAHATVGAAVAEASRRLPGLTLFAGGKSFGGRMTSQAQAASPLSGVHGLAFLGFPLHPAGRPSDERAKHLFDVRIPMLFLQGTRDQLADLGRLSGIEPPAVISCHSTLLPRLLHAAPGASLVSNVKLVALHLVRERSRRRRGTG